MKREAHRARAASQSAMMHEDCRLADGLSVPQGEPEPSPRLALLTGATGFLGPYVVRQLLSHTSMRLVCLVRAPTHELAMARVLESLSAVAMDPQVVAARVSVVCGDLAQPLLGLSAETFECLALAIDRIYHVGAIVNWSKSYEQLRATNVLGCLELLKLAVHRRPKPMLFVSTIAVCFARSMTAPIDEYTDMSEHLDQMPLAYAQSKWVAESLMRQVARRGLPVTILRPALISGDSRSGACNLGDLTAAVIEGTVNTQVAMECDWSIDFVPVDFVASVVCRALDIRKPYQVIHLVHDRPRQWRELVLWLHLHGYPIRFVDEADWRGHMFDAQRARQNRLYEYRGFFAGSERAGVPPMFPAYVGDAQRRVSHQASFAATRELGLAPAPIDGPLLDRYMRYYRATGLLQLPAAPRRGPLLPESLDRHQDEALAAITRVHAGGTQGEWVEVPLGAANNGILNSIAAARFGSRVGVRHFRWSGPADEQPSDVIVKTKLSDQVLIDLTCELATICSPTLGTAFKRHGGSLGLTGSHERELAFYERHEPRLTRFLPRAYTTLRDAKSGLWTVSMQHVGASCARAVPDQLGIWPAASISRVIQGIAAVHSIWYECTHELADSGHCIGGRDDPAALADRRGLWTALREYAQPWFEAWGGAPLLARHEHVVSESAPWQDQLFNAPQALIHNDFNPRNVFLGSGADEDLCIIDWELARIGLPQHDVAEFLCFTMDPECGAHDLKAWIDEHRLLLAQAAGRDIEPAQWYRGYAASLDYLLAERLPMYTLMHRFQPQRFLPRLIRSWLRMRQIVDGLTQRLQPRS